jgi:NAD(P)-dependent dehydrogenase (short-subunit alcohol dehydrogenase family)
VAKLDAISTHEGGPCFSVPADLSRSEEVERVAAAVVGGFGGQLHCLVNNSGMGTGGDLAELPLADWERTINLNLNMVRRLTMTWSRRYASYINCSTSLALSIYKKQNTLGGGC